MDEIGTATEAAKAMTDLTGKTPVEIDTVLADLDGEFPRLEHARAAALVRIHKLVGDKQVRRGVWKRGHQDVVNALLATAPGHTALAEAKRAEDALAANRAEFDRLDGEYYRRGGWTRFIQVEHIHSGWNCVGGTLDRGEYRSERHWVPQLSGHTEAEALAVLAERGEILCTHCFPNAPTLPRQRPADECPGSGRYVDHEAGEHRLRQAVSPWATCPECGQRIGVTSAWNYRKHDTREAAARKEAAKLKEAGKIKLPNGDVKTPRAIEIAAVDAHFTTLWYRGTDNRAEERERDMLIAVLAEHEDTAMDEVAARIVKKAQAKYKREGGR